MDIQNRSIAQMYRDSYKDKALDLDRSNIYFSNNVFFQYFLDQEAANTYIAKLNQTPINLVPGLPIFPPLNQIPFVNEKSFSFLKDYFKKRKFFSTEEDDFI